MNSLATYASDDEGVGPTPTADRAPAAPEVEDDEEVELGGDVFGLQADRRPAASANGGTGRGTEKVTTVPDVLPSTDYNSSSALIMRPTDTEMHVNVAYDDLMRPQQGPSNPYSDRKLEKMNVMNGFVQEEYMNDLDFKRQQRSFDVLKYARNPTNLSTLDATTGASFVGDVEGALKAGGSMLMDDKPTKAVKRAQKRKRNEKGELGVFDPDDPDEEAEVDRPKEYKGPWATYNEDRVEITGPEEEEYEAPQRVTMGKKPQLAEGKREVAFGEEKSVFHGKSMRDYQGRTYMHVPTDADVNLNADEPPEQCFVPKRCIHTFTGHTKAISNIRLFPNSGHLILSGSMDSRIKLWDVYHDGKCLRTYMGHSKAVRDITFSNDGRRFLSAGYDRQMKLWDTETGQCIKAFSNGKTPFCIRFHPDDDKQNIFLAGMQDKKIIQYDMNTSEITQEYDQHLGPVNTITFVDENRRFVTTSDDKTIRAWDYDIPVVIKYIAEPSMHSMPAVGVHPNKKYLAMQSLDNQILIYSADTFRQHRNKRFAGHTTAGYACEVGFSPNGQFLSSGDGSGNMVFWDWKSCRIRSRLRCHDKVVISHAWLPHEPSKLVTGGWDGLIKLWD